MEENDKNNNNRERISKEEMARRISGNISARNSNEIFEREERRRWRAEDRELLQRSPVNNPYLHSEYDRGGSSQRERHNRNNHMSDGSRQRAARQARIEKKRRQKRKRLISAGVTLAVMLTIVGVGVGIWHSNGKKKYEGVFLDNTFINGVTVSRKTPDEAVELVKRYSDVPDNITLTRPDGIDVNVGLKELGATDNIETSVLKIYKSQSHNGWFKSKGSKSDFKFKVTFDFDRDKLFKEVKNKIIDGQKTTSPKNAYITRDSDGFKIVPEVLGTSIDEEKTKSLYDYIDAFLDEGTYTIDLKNCNCYERPKVVASDLSSQLSRLNGLFDAKFTFDFGFTREVLKGSKTFDWVVFENDDPSKAYTVDYDLVMVYVENLAAKYDTFGKDRSFKSTSRGKMKAKQGNGCYGWWIDRDKTTELIIDLIEDGKSSKVNPCYYEDSYTGYSYSANKLDRTKDNDIGRTYCEIDLKKQHFWYYEDGEKRYECDIVSGMPTDDKNTPEGIYKIWYKDTDCDISGIFTDKDNWSDKTKYWINFSTIGIGFYVDDDIKDFGGDKYLENGTHGSIAIPKDAAKYIYDSVPLGTPVIMYW